jgi:putative membrane protein
MVEHRGEQRQGLGGMAKAADAVGGMVGTLKAGLGSKSANAFVANASRGDVYEIEAARIAQQRARSPEVRHLAERMLQDHTDSSNKLMAALSAHGDQELIAQIEGGLDQHRQTMVDHLRQASDEEFDSVYIAQQKLAHRETLTLFEGFTSSDEHPELVAYARGMLPTLQQHKEMVDRIEGSGSIRS